MTRTAIPRETHGSVSSIVNYVTRIDEPLYTYYQAEPPDGMAPSNEVREPQVVTITSMRDLPEVPVLDVCGFELIGFTTAVADIYDPAEREATYYREVAEAVQSRTGASEVRIFQPFLRGEEAERRAPGSISAPAGFAHVDYTVRTGPEWFDTHLGEDADEFRGRRFAYINLWRPITGPMKDHPLALCDTRTVSQDDLIPSRTITSVDDEGLHSSHGSLYETEIYSVAYNPAHRWYYVPDMMPDEAILLKNYDSSEDGGVSRFTPHTAFEDPTTPEDRLPRASIEIRALTIW